MKVLNRIFLPKSSDERSFLKQHLSRFAEKCSNKLILDVGAGKCRYAYLFNKRNINPAIKYENIFLKYVTIAA